MTEHYCFSYIIICFVIFCDIFINAINEAKIKQGENSNLGEGLQFLKEYDREASNMCYQVTNSQWKYSTNITDQNKRKMIEEQTLSEKFQRISWRKAISFHRTHLPDPIAKRQLNFLAIEGRASLPDDKYNEIYHLISEMKDVYNNEKLCPFKGLNHNNFCNLNLEPDIVKIMALSRNYDELLYFWTEWRRKTGPPMKNKFMRYVELANQAASLIGFADAGEQMLAVYEDDNLEKDLAEVYSQIEPLYKELHSYVRRKLALRYGDERVRRDGPIPAHLLGNMWAQNWENINDLVRPFPFVFDATLEMQQKEYTPQKMFQLAEEFFTSMGMKAMPPEFWVHSMLEKPPNKQVQCTASAWDFCNRIDYRIKQCTIVSMQDLISIHHEMSHIQYYLQYQNQPYIFRDGANPAFHEAIADTITLSVKNPVHLHRVGLFNNRTDSFEININFLMSMALEKLAYMPFAYIVDQWRFKIFSEGVQNMNLDWWTLRLKYQGILPPVPRTENDFDPGSKYHIISDQPYLKYFIAQVLQFQMFDELCTATNNPNPLHNCDLYRSREAGRILSEIMKLGRSVHWREVIKIMTHGKTDKLSAEGVVKYFEPLMKWLKEQNRVDRNVGWNINNQDAALFQPWKNNDGNAIKPIDLLTLVFIIIVIFQY